MDQKKLNNWFLDLVDILKHDLLGHPLPKAEKFSIDKLNLEFETHHNPGEGFWIEAKNYPGLVASGDTPEELREAVLDSILTYFDVPRALAKRFPDTLTLRLPDGTQVYPNPKTVVRLSWA